ncbi:hypothetical protein FRC08_014315 [Ceratobasidium sp. 394]|nr:hypothetical protein FRC08_014315 [Ceratobasidium sp. 394]
MSPRPHTTTSYKPAVVALPTPPPSPYSAMSSAATNARHASAAQPQCVPQLMFPPTSSYSSSSAGSARPNQNGCTVGAVSCNHDKSYHQPQACRCRRGLNVYCTRCKAFCYSHGC